MIHFILNHRPTRRATQRRWKLLPLSAAAALLTLSSCNDEDAVKPPPAVTVTDTQPIGAGLTVVGFAIVGAAVVVVLGRLLR